MAVPTEYSNPLEEGLTVGDDSNGSAGVDPDRERGYRTFALADWRKLAASSLEGWLTLL